MLNRQTQVKPRSRGELDHYLDDSDYISYADIIGFVRRYLFTIISFVVLGVVLAGLYVSSAVPLYKARAQLLIDPATTQFIQDRRTELSLDAAKIESQIAIINSDTIVGAVVDRLDLKNDPEFRGGSRSQLRRILFWNSGSSDEVIAPDPQEDLGRIATGNLRAAMDVRRSGLSYAIDIAVTTREPAKSARIANAIADAYEQDQVNDRTRSAKQWSEWLETRIHRLRGQLDEAARDLQGLKSGRGYSPTQEPGPTERPVSVAVLEATVEAYRNIYASYFQALTTAVEQQSSPVVNARIITTATPPLDKSYPRGKLIMAFGMFVGLLSGVGIGFLRASMDTSVRTSKQVKHYIGLECLARIPKIPQTISLSWAFPFIARTPSTSDRRMMFRYVTEAPFSQFAGSVTALKTALVKAGRQDGVRCFGITSALPEEGKSTLAANLASAFALSSYRVLIIDADVHNSVISQTFAPAATRGLFEVLKGEAEFKDCLITGKGAAPDVLPLVADKRTPVSYSWLSSESMLSLIKHLKEEYHFVIVDLPPLAPVADGLTISSLLDGVILAVQWGRTTRELVADVTYGLNLADANILGLVLTKVDQSAVNLRLKKAWKYYG